MAKDYYQILGISKLADEKEIKTAYRRLARKWHPDVNPNDKTAEARFKEISEANEVLGDPEKRKLYDQYGSNWEQAQNFSNVRAGNGNSADDYSNFQFSTAGANGFGSIFEQFFGGAGGFTGAGSGIQDVETMQPRDIEKVVELTLEEVDSGTKRVLTYQTLDAQRLRDGVTTVPTTKKVEVKIPAGISDGKKLRVPGKGAAGANGKTGDLYVVIRWLPHPQFKPSGENLEVEVPVGFTVAALGGEIKVPTLRASVTMKIPEGTQTNQAFRLSGQGITRLGSVRGDLMARVKITVPKHPSNAQRDLLRQLADLEGTSK